MKRVLIAALLIVVMVLPGAAAAAKPDKPVCTTIQDGVLTYSAGSYLEGQPLVLGFDPYGYNYQGKMFKGLYNNAYNNGSNLPPSTDETDTYLMMKWNDGWLSNTDCDGDGKLDRHYGYPSYIGSGAWLTNHMWGEYEVDGETCTWNYFCKIVAAPSDATLTDGVWYAADGTEIGPDIWGQFATVLEVYNDPCAGDGGVAYKSPAGPGLGKW